ncbi:hypothetical protein GCM10011316_09520 [Roseibium aquae]|uniref:Uncharacterized protein n=1 Tax=Roseibium aquae TaxID=1323746 RepID=A0A916WY65_9HYPH|nr:hypothetical protein [Roseibium aquae]GGB39617.1 hypothetical protein GCM10011316_09520 [Roseibium aquae]
MKRSYSSFILTCVFAIGVAALARSDNALAESATLNPMKTPNPMMPNPGMPMSPMSVAPMQPLGGLAGQPETGVARDPEHGNLPISAGMEETYYSCTACHSAQTFAQMRLTDERWEYLWDWMIKEQGMADYGEEARTVILGYLKEHFSSER